MSAKMSMAEIVAAARAEEAAPLLTDTEDYHVTYEWELDGKAHGTISLRRMVWKKANRRKDQDLMHEQIVARLPFHDLPTMVRDLVALALDAGGPA